MDITHEMGHEEQGLG